MSKVAVVTGGARGIGKAIARRLASDGMKVIINYNGSADQAEALKKEIEENGGEASTYQCNVADFTACEAFISEVIKTEGSLDVLVNNAGITRDNLLMKMSEADFDEVINTNLKGAFNTTRFTVRQMLKQRSGRIINISSVVGETGNAGQANYAASKAGVIGLTKATAREVASRGILVNAVAPGFISTDMTEELSDKVKEATLSQIPLGTYGSPEDVAGVISFLAADETKYITGQVLNVDGGMVI
ncbi:3-oxoacyl-[acyl-carrier-protein] reductase [Ohessyouella blattaphilus]|uniref:3-oxoacyl-[acyl-carrier-protein] reductase n=1 Tax=Ohessyouella blattaphilus TaxID=2949333 RepID=A0ABT1EHX8_9FIRM|nr:3-oxoacyl-[acyl-carrier-protein] reductase [Ohessyouella blattaphilus]MCP1108902.1 3-oxoacyl-[acyl-carrier-protein] reductase [Ohessyouella blattaphilus]MCR8562296.1 3-oxoacyl-[acyl-carrier-protein] reductase [Ohessyouella blattaphilus]